MPLDAALQIAARGYRVFPVDDQKHPHITGWPAEATRDQATIRRWWSNWPEALAGVACGDGLVVVDLDVKNGRNGVQSWNDDRGLSVATPSGGQHRYFRTDEAFGNRTGALTGVDVRAARGFVVAWCPGDLPPIDDLPVLPEDLARRLRVKAEPAQREPVEPETDPAARDDYLRTALDTEAFKVECAPEGQRNSTLNTAAFNLGQLVEAGLDADEVRERLTEAAEAAGLERGEIAGTIRSGLESGKRQPRDVPTRAAEPDVPDGRRYEREVQAELLKLRVREAARQLFAAEQAPPLQPLDAGTLAEVLARPERPERITGLLGADSSMLVIAQRKTGKTTFVGNLARSLVSGETFLGQFLVAPVKGTVALLNYEVSGQQVARWYSDMGVDQQRLILVNLRGQRNPLAHKADRERLAAFLRERDVETLIVDPFGRAFPGTSQNDAGEVGSFLVGLDEFARAEVGARDLILTAHAGWNGERTRGSSALEDWADSLVTLTSDDAECRYLSALGRDVDLDEDRLDYDPETRLLTLSGAGSRKVAGAERRLETLADHAAEVITNQPGLNGTQVAQALRDADAAFQRGDDSKALRLLVTQGRVRNEPGPRNSKLYYPVTPSYPDLPHGVGHPVTPPPFRGGVTGVTEVDSSATPDRGDSR